MSMSLQERATEMGSEQEKNGARDSSSKMDGGAGSSRKRRVGGGVVWVLAAIAALSLVNAAHQFYVGSGATSRRLAGLWLMLGFVAVLATWTAWRRARWAWLAAGVWVVDAVVTTIVGTALMYGGRPSISSVLPGVVIVAVLGGMIVRSVRRRTCE